MSKQGFMLIGSILLCLGILWLPMLGVFLFVEAGANVVALEIIAFGVLIALGLGGLCLHKAGAIRQQDPWNNDKR